jgi:hypothetical protein
MTSDGPEYLRRKPAAAFLRSHGFPIADTTMAAMGSEGPPFKLFGKYAVYKKAELLAWAHARFTEPHPRRSASAAELLPDAPAI